MHPLRCPVCDKLCESEEQMRENPFYKDLECVECHTIIAEAAGRKRGVPTEEGEVEHELLTLG